MEINVTPAPEVLNFDNDRDVVICWGDSITESMGMKPGFTYPNHLQGHIGSQRKVINAGVPGETSWAIMSRGNAVDFCLTNDITFPVGESTVSCGRTLFSVKDEYEIKYMGFGNQLPLDNIIIGDKHFKIRFEGGDKYDKGTYHIVRDDVSETLTFKKGTPVRYDHSDKYDSIYCAVVLAGANDTWGELIEGDGDALIDRYRRIINGAQRYIVVIPHYINHTDYAEKFFAAFGDHAINLRKYFQTDAFTDYGITPTEQDKDCIKNNWVPTTFTWQNGLKDCHLSDIGYKVLGDLVYKKGVELGYWK